MQVIDYSAVYVVTNYKAVYAVASTRLLHLACPITGAVYVTAAERRCSRWRVAYAAPPRPAHRRTREDLDFILRPFENESQRADLAAPTARFERWSSSDIGYRNQCPMRDIRFKFKFVFLGIIVHKDADRAIMMTRKDMIFSSHSSIPTVTSEDMKLKSARLSS